MTHNEPRIGEGHFHWNGGAWFGSLAGATAYMLLGSAAFVTQHLLLGIVWAVCFLTAVSVGIWLWTRRSLISPYPAIQILIATCGVTGVIAIVSAIYLSPRFLAVVNLSPIGGLFMLLLFPAIMLQFHILEKRARRDKQNRRSHE